MTADVLIGSLFSGYRGLDMAVEAVTGGRTIWCSDIDPGANAILAHHWPGVPNLGDITAVDWDCVPRVDVLTGGFPCQDVSMAGRRAGMKPGSRSGLWSAMAGAIDALRPALVVAENVRGLLSADGHADVEPCPWCLGDTDAEPALRALGAVLADLADMRYDAAWYGLPASAIGAPHGRFRVFILAWPADAERDRHQGQLRVAAGPAALRRRPADPDGTDAAPDADPFGRDGWAGEFGPGRWGQPADRGDAPAHAEGDGRDERRPEPARLQRGPDAAVGGGTAPADPDRGGRQRRTETDPAGRSDGGGPRAATARPDGGAAADPGDDGRGRHPEPDGEPDAGSRGARRDDADGRTGAGVEWGEFEPAIRRWEQLTRPAPAPTEAGSRGGQRLSPVFVEWLMGLPAGHVTAVPGLSRNEQLKALGNGVVPAQAEAALRHLLAAVASERAA